MRKTIASWCYALCGLAALSAAPAHADTSSWGAKVGTVGIDDRTTWCTTTTAIDPVTNRPYASSSFRTTGLDGVTTPNVTNLLAEQQVRAYCYRNAGKTIEPTPIDSPWSTDAQGDVARTPSCPATHPHLGYARCRIRTLLLPPYVYAGSLCGTDATSTTASQATGQLTGAFSEVTPQPLPLFNNTAAQAQVGGTDMGFQFLAQGGLFFGFGDTWENELNFPGLLGFRSSALVRTTDFNRTDGISFQNWDTVIGNPFAAREVIPSPHQWPNTGEFSAIPTAGFGVSQNGLGYRFLWYASIRGWPDPNIPGDTFKYNHSTLSWSINGGLFARGDLPPLGTNPPVWDDSSAYGAGAIWVDRENGWIYFFGMRTYQPNTGIRLARVRGTASAVLDRTQYEYWVHEPGKALPEWKRDTGGASPPPHTIDVLPAGNWRPEFSVSYNAYIGRFILMLRNGVGNFELRTAPSVTGPWSLVAGAQMPPGGFRYGPYTNETLTGDGQTVYFALSEWNGAPLIWGQPYNIGMWRYTINGRSTIAGCVD